MDQNTTNNMPFAEEVNYWKTSTTSTDTWLEKTSKMITSIGGKVLAEGFVNENVSGRSAFMITFELDENSFKLVWQVLKSKTNNPKAARVQAATALYHDVKAKCMRAVWAGARTAFMEWLVLPDGKTASELSNPEIADTFPKLFSGRQDYPRLSATIFKSEEE